MSERILDRKMQFMRDHIHSQFSEGATLVGADYETHHNLERLIEGQEVVLYRKYSEAKYLPVQFKKMIGVAVEILGRFIQGENMDTLIHEGVKIWKKDAMQNAIPKMRERLYARRDEFSDEDWKKMEIVIDLLFPFPEEPKKITK